MKTKIFLALTMCFMLTFDLLAQQAGYILFVRDNDVDSGFVSLLQGQGFEVAVEGDDYSQMLEGAQIDSAEGAALIILSRNLITSDFDNGANPGVADQWNGFDVPLINMSAWLARSSRLQWFNSTAVSCSQDTIIVTEDGEDSDIFDDIEIDGAISFYDNADGTQGSDWIDNSADPAGNNGTIIATSQDGNNVAIAIWESGSNFYEGTEQTPADDRIFFAAGKSDCGSAVEPDALFNLNETGTAMFLNLVTMYVLQPGAAVNNDIAAKIKVIPNPADNMLTIDGITSYDAVEIYSLNGSLIKSFSNSDILDISGFAKGLYMIKIKAGTDVYTSKFIKK